MKNKLSIDEQIEHMKENGITFKIFEEDEAKNFLIHSNYFFKVKSFSKNFKKVNGQYQNLEFAYLKELALMDTLLRDIILELSLIIEHVLKVQFIRHVTNNKKEDGYQIVSKYLSSNQRNKPFIFKIYNQSRTKVDFYTRGLMDKYYKYNFPVWAFIEILTFSELINFLKFYYENYKIKKFKKLNSLLYNVKKLRNVSAHNNCFLNNLEINEEFNQTKRLKTKVEKLGFKNIYDNDTIEYFLKSPVIHDYASVLVVFDVLCIGEMKNKIKEEKTEYSVNRFSKHLDYFSNHSELYQKLKFIDDLTKKILKLK
ncbi:Abi family protein [Campylobacter ureolyticus]|uniref:Abi-like protein n=1 Tax=Campylobacter ureolyticus ACS-301-V-Sch3b TaxID=883165 RepID=S3XB91_9BACT|nr:Abi family protein [Campylobacter ureolyticus]EPH07386.1 hypothetical protein HMPREF9309_01607 [Campylobacter ureolyticus ACS-301-V-Sch3b]